MFKLKYKSGLSYLPLEYPSDQDLEEPPHVDFCSPGEWKPDERNDNDEDVFDLIPWRMRKNSKMMNFWSFKQMKI